MIIFYILITLLGHYTFSMQRVTYNLGREYAMPQSAFDPLFPSWFMPLQILTTVVKYALLAYIAFALERFGLAFVLFLLSAIIHITAPLFPATMFFRIFYDKAKFIQETIDYNAGSDYIFILQNSHLFK